jgi:hypothetical protein
LQWTLFPSPVFTSSWLVSLLLPLVVLNNIVLLPSLSLLNKCSMLKTWCALLTPDMADILQHLLSSVVVCQPKKSTNKCWTSKTKTHLISLSGSQTTLNPLFVIFLPRVSRWLLLSLVTQLQSKKCSKE